MTLAAGLGRRNPRLASNAVYFGVWEENECFWCEICALPGDHKFTLLTRLPPLLVPPKTTDSPDQQFQAARTLLNQLLDVPAIEQLIELEH